MNLANSLFMATGFAYLALAVFTAMGKDALVGIDNNVEMFSYSVAFFIFMYVANYPCSRIMKLFLGIVYAFAAIGSFIGFPQKWKAYWKSAPIVGSDAGQAFMSAWDLALSIAFFSLC